MAQTLMGSNIYGEFAHDQSGTVSLSADGSRLAIGARFNDGNAMRCGCHGFLSSTRFGFAPCLFN